MSSHSTPHIYAVMGAAIVGIIGAAGVFLYEKLAAEKRLAQQMQTLDKKVESMSLELQALKDLQKERANATRKNKPVRKIKRSPNHVTPNGLNNSENTDFAYTTDTDMYNTAAGTDLENSSEEFYDLSSDTETETVGISQILTTADKLLDGNEEDITSGLRTLESNLENFKHNPQILWRIGRGCFKMFKLCENDLEKKEWVNKGLKSCEHALTINETNADTHKWFAILVGSRSEFVGTKDKIQDGYLFKKHVDRALELNPLDSYLHHLLGRFKYEVAGLSWLERKLAASLFAEPPMATYSEAILDFLRAEDLSQIPNKDNRLLLAKCYIGNSDYETALEWLDLAKNIPPEINNDQTIDGEVQSLLTKFASYRK